MNDSLAVKIINQKVSTERIDVFCEGKSVRPLDDDEKGALSRLRAVFFSKAKESVPSLNPETD